jgi:hypothetical protein
MPNNFWGWGGEDNAQRNRIMKCIHQVIAIPMIGSVIDLENVEGVEDQGVESQGQGVESTEGQGAEVSEFKLRWNIKKEQLKQTSAQIPKYILDQKIEEDLKTWKTNGFKQIQQHHERVIKVSKGIYTVSVNLGTYDYPYTNNDADYDISSVYGFYI